ncbi:VWA domain-containing protein [Marinobacterium rhizophilum]|uniref:VWA domain-containing protein n=1 Tax=Marinobacterium rhizophilum TaxID=420402 RepID=A0ABY5HMK3_9GAMM|nr:VWA domain-containing protein [Marinobacterium rhizophilum]UTW12499.1 VWA domain-containing protein [Marinobacterium rhizophilum]
MGDDTKSLSQRSSHREIDQFLNRLAKVPSGGGGRLVFALDATASREPTWDHACQLQSEMFEQTRSLGGLSVQLCYYRGYREFHATDWLCNTDRLMHQMNAVRCLGGHTQIARLLTHVRSETRLKKVQAAIFIGDCVEEPVDDLCALAGELGLLQVPVFIFHEGNDSTAERAFRHISQLTGGAYCQFDQHSPQLMRELLGAIAVYASGGHRALEDFSQGKSAALLRLTRQLRN